MGYRRADFSFNTQPPEGGWPSDTDREYRNQQFQHAAARRRLERHAPTVRYRPSFNTQPPEGGWDIIAKKDSSHECFNTQPPEGGWDIIAKKDSSHECFNTQPPEGGWFPHRRRVV